MKTTTLLVVADPGSRYLARLEELPEQVDVVAGLAPEIFASRAPAAEVMLVAVPRREVVEPVFAMAKRLKWMHSLSAGLETLWFPALRESPVTVTNAAGVYAASLAEWAMGAVLFFAKDFRRLVRNQSRRVWEQFDVDMVAGSTLGVLGFGGIGRATARLAKAFGMRVIAMRRNSGAPLEQALADVVLGPGGKSKLIAQSDYLLVSAPLTEETRGLLTHEDLKAMKRSAVLINVARGPIVQEAALVEALREGWIRGAALDVFDEEPLPAGHPFYAMENVLLSPHSADHTATWMEDSMQFFLNNFGRFLNGQPLLNVVNKQAGY